MPSTGKKSSNGWSITSLAPRLRLLQRPGRFAEARVVADLDAKGVLAAGEQPINQILVDLNALGGDDIYKLVAPFLPAPVADKAPAWASPTWSHGARARR